MADHDNAALLLNVRDKGFEGPIYALVNDPLHRRPLATWGATAVDTPAHVLALALASHASRRIRPTIPGVQQLGEHVGVAELRIHRDSPLVGEILAQARLRDRHGEVVLGQWQSGRFVPRPLADTPLSPGDIIVAVGRRIRGGLLCRRDRRSICGRIAEGNRRLLLTLPGAAFR